MWKNEPSLAIGGVDTAENGPSKVGRVPPPKSEVHPGPEIWPYLLVVERENAAGVQLADKGAVSSAAV